MNGALKDLEGNDSSLIEVLSQHFFDGTEENHEESQLICYPSTSELALPIRQSVQFQYLNDWDIVSGFCIEMKLT
jgi:hypothetical protein